MLAEVARVERCVTVRGAPRPPLLDAGGMRVSVKSPDAAEGSLVAESRSMTWRGRSRRAPLIVHSAAPAGGRWSVEREPRGPDDPDARVTSLRILDITLVVEI